MPFEYNHIGEHPRQTQNSHALAAFSADSTPCLRHHRQCCDRWHGQCPGSRITYESAEEFIADEEAADSDCLILDLHLPGKNGLELQRELAAAGCKCRIVFITALDDEKTRTQALEAGTSDFLRKPIDGNRLLDAVQAALRSA